MASTKRLPHSTLNAYHTNSSLLYQFILAEFLITYKEVKCISQHVGRLNSIPKKLLTKEEYEKALTGISASIAVMSGSSQEYMRLFTWNLAEGAVVKLKNYCAFLLEQDDEEDERLSAMHRATNRTWLLCLHSMDLLRALKHTLSTAKDERETAEEVNLRESLLHSLEKMSHHMRRLAKLVAQMTYDYRRDENVVLFLLRHKVEFDELYGKLFVSKLLLKMFPKGTKSIEQFICKKYNARGFQDLIPFIKDKIGELQG